MLARAKKFIALTAIALLSAVISLPLKSSAATSPVVATLSPITQGLRSPVKIALDAAGNIFVADYRAGGVLKFNTFGIKLMLIPVAGDIGGLALAQDGTLLVSQGAAVVRYNATTGEETGRLTGGELQLPGGIAVDDVTGYIYVADSLANQIVEYTASGNYAKAFGKGITSDASGNRANNPLGKLSMPMGVAFDKVSRHLAVADTLGQRIQFFDTAGNFIKSIGSPISTTVGAIVGMMQFDAPVSVAFEYSKGAEPVVLDRMYVVDAFQNNIQVINPATATTLLVGSTGKNYIGSAGMANGQLMGPGDAVFDAVNNRLLVANALGITIFGIDGGQNPFDNIAPIFTVDPPPATVAQSAIAISGTVEAGALVSVAVGAPAAASPIVYTSATTWMCDISGLIPGDNVISVSATDAAGNVAPAQAVTIAYLLQTAVLNITSAVPPLTNLPELELSGVADEGSTVLVTNNTTSLTGTATLVGSSWSYRVLLAEGLNSITVTAQKPLAAKATAQVAVTLDSTPPLLVVSALSDGSYTSNQVQNIAGDVTDANPVTLLVNNAPVPLLNSSFSTAVSLVPGANVISVTAVDAAGNVTVNRRTLNFDAAAPIITVASPMDNSFTNKATLSISGTVDEAATITVAGVTAVIDANNNWSADITLTPGLNTIEVVASDLYGNSATLKRSVTLDAVNPILAITSPAQDIALNQSGATITGTVNDDNTALLTYTVNGVTATAPVEAGTFAFNVAFANEGTFRVDITATDYAGNSTTATRSLIYDATPPVIAIDPVIATVFVPTVTITGTIENGASLSVSTDAPTADAAVVEASATTWKSTVTGLIPGDNRITVRAADAAGNIASEVSVVVTYTLPAPSLAFSSTPPALTNISEFLLNGTVEDGATVIVANDATAVSEPAIVSGTAWSYRLKLAEGFNAITVTAQKPQSVKSTLPLSITLDTIPPALTVSALSDGSYTSTQVQNITGGVSDAGALELTLNGTQVTIQDGSFSAPLTLATGANTVSVVVRDSAGNVTVNNRTIYFDADKPVLTIASPMDNSITNVATVKISGGVNKAAVVTVAGISANVDSNYNWSANIELVAGLNTVEVVATDLYGNSSTLKRSILFDDVKPVLAIESPTQDIALNRSVAIISGTINDSDQISLSYSLNGKTVPVTVVEGRFRFEVNFDKEGVYPVSITAVDTAGNTATAIRNLIYDITPPVVILDAVKWQTHAMGGKISGTVEPGATVTVKEGNRIVGTVIIDGGKWSANLSGVTYNQTKLGIVAVDAAGNSVTRMLK